MSNDFTFNFPVTKFCSDNGYTRRGQADQITQEAAEVFSAAEGDDDEKFIVELLDCIHACETALAEFDDALIDEAWAKVIWKNAERGYYGEYDMAAYIGQKMAADRDEVEHPAHYTQDKIESIEIIEHTIAGLDGVNGYLLGNVLKYGLRAGKKGIADIDLQKANNYAHRLCTGEWRWEHGQEKA